MASEPPAIGILDGRVARASAARIFARPATLVALAICACAGLASILSGPDNYWDLRFYHLYAPWAYLHDRYLTDVAPAEWQSYFNPIADFLFYGMISSRLNEMPRLVAFIMGAMHGLNAVLVAAIAWHVLRPPQTQVRAALCGAATLIGVSGAGFLPLLGGTSNDLVNSIFVLGALFGLLRIADASNQRADWRAFAGAGLCAGVGLGLKYTAAVYVPGLAVVALVAALQRRSLAGLVAFALAAALAFLAIAGHHLLVLWRDFGNPLFPMLNEVFQSPWYLPESSAEDQYRPDGLWGLVVYPFRWMKINSYLVSEKPLRDWRGALAYLAICAALLAPLIGPARDRVRRNAAETRDLGLVIIFVAISYVCWAEAFGIYRYFVPAELLTGVVSMGAVVTLLRTPALRIAAAAVILVTLAATTVYPDWGRGQFGERYVDVRVPPLPPDSIVVMASGQPVAFFIPFAEPRAQYLGIENDFLDLTQDNLLVSRVVSLMRTPGRPKFIVSVGDFDAGALDKVLAHFDLTLGSPCRPIVSNLENPALSICPAVAR